MSNTSLNMIRNLMPSWDHKGTTLFYPTMPSQSMGEWRAYLEFIEAYFINRRVHKPLVVEIGIGFGKQKLYYKDVLGYNYIGIDNRKKRSAAEVGAENVSLSKPDIIGDSNDPKTKSKLVSMLKGREVNVVYLDASHQYEQLKKDYELYALLAKNIVAIHDIELEPSVKRFWNELMAKSAKNQAHDRTFMTLIGKYVLRHGKEYVFGQGTGIIIKENGDG